MSLENKSVLIIDDDDMTLKMLSMIFQSAGARVLIENDCKDASKVLKQLRPDIIILNISEVDMGDSAYCRQIKEKFSRLAIPIIVTSTVGVHQYKDRLSYLNHIQYFQKPYSSLHLLETVSRFLEIGMSPIKANPFNLSTD